MTKKRLDEWVVERGLAASLDEARRLILAGKIRARGQGADKAGHAYSSDAKIELIRPKSRYVGRGALKLENAVERSGLKFPEGGRALDIGASTGGFTDWLLQHGAGEVVAVDTGRGQIHERLRADARVELHEQTNARYLRPDHLGDRPFDWIVIDVSFISLELILPVCPSLLRQDGLVLALVKPQFEAERGEVGAGGVVRDRSVHGLVISRMMEYCREHGWLVRRVVQAEPRGAEGNREFFFRLSRGADAGEPAGAEPKIDVEAILDEAYNLPADK